MSCAWAWPVVAILGFLVVAFGLIIWTLQHHARKRG